MLPFAMLSAVELTKIPLVALLFGVDGARWRVLALVGLACVTAATFANFVFGFERGFNERIRAVQTAEQVTLDSQRDRRPRRATTSPPWSPVRPRSTIASRPSPPKPPPSVSNPSTPSATPAPAARPPRSAPNCAQVDQASRALDALEFY